MTIREQILLGTVVPDYTNDRFTPPAPLPTPVPLPPVPAFKGREIRYAPPPAIPRIDTLIADTLDGALEGRRIIDLLLHTRKAAVLFAVRRAKGNQSRAAEILGVGRMTLRNWCNQFHIDPALYIGRGKPKEVA